MAWSLLGSGSTQLLQFGAGLLLAGLVGPEMFGRFGMAMALVGLGSVVTEAGLGPAIVQRKTVPAPLLITLFRTGVAIGLLQFGLLWVMAPSLAAAMGDPALALLLRGCGAVLLFGPLGLVQRSLLTRELSFRALARIEVAATVTGLSVALSLALAGSASAAMVARATGTAAVTAFLCWVGHRWRPAPLRIADCGLPDCGLRIGDCGLGTKTGSADKGSPSLSANPQSAIPNPQSEQSAMRREVWRFGAPLVGAELLSQLAMNIDFLLIGRFLGPETLGGYALAYSLATVPQGRLAPALVRVLFPSLARLQDDGESARRSYLGLVRRLALVTFPLLTLLALAGPAAIVGILGSRWAGAAVPLPALCVAGAAYTMATTVGAIYRSQGRPDQELWTTAARALLLAGCVAGAIWGWGTAQAVAIAVAGYALTSTLLFQPVANRLIGLRMRDYLRAMAPGALLAAAVGILGLMT